MTNHDTLHEGSISKSKLTSKKSSKYKMTFDARKKREYDMISLKRNLNLCKEKNHKLKEQMITLKKQVKSKGKYVNELFSKATRSFCKQERTSLGPNAEAELKKYVKALEKDIDNARREREELIKCCKDSELMDIEDELKGTLEECRMIRSMIKEATEEKNNEKIRTLKQLSYENKRLLKIIERQNYELGRFKDLSGRQGSKMKLRLRPRASESRKSTKSLGATPAKRVSRKSLQNESDFKKDSMSKRNTIHNYRRNRIYTRRRFGRYITI